MTDGKIFVKLRLRCRHRCMDVPPTARRPLWRRDLGLPILNAPVVNGGRIFLSTHNNHFYTLAEADGRVLWEHPAIEEPAGILASSSVAVAGEVVIAPFSSGEIFAFRVDNGQSSWSDVLSRTGHVTQLSEIDAIAGRPVIDRDMVFAISQSGVIVGINLSTGERVWSKQIGGVQTPWVAGDYVYVVVITIPSCSASPGKGEARCAGFIICRNTATRRRSVIPSSGPGRCWSPTGSSWCRRTAMPRRSRPIPGNCWAGWTFRTALISPPSSPTATVLFKYQ